MDVLPGSGIEPVPVRLIPAVMSLSVGFFGSWDCESFRGFPQNRPFMKRED